MNKKRKILICPLYQAALLIILIKRHIFMKYRILIKLRFNICQRLPNKVNNNKLNKIIAINCILKKLLIQKAIFRLTLYTKWIHNKYKTQKKAFILLKQKSSKTHKKINSLSLKKAHNYNSHQLPISENLLIKKIRTKNNPFNCKICKVIILRQENINNLQIITHLKTNLMYNLLNKNSKSNDVSRS